MQKSWSPTLLIGIVAIVAISSMLAVNFQFSTISITGNAVITGIPTVQQLPNLVVLGLSSAPASVRVDSPVLIRFLVFNRGAASSPAVPFLDEGESSSKKAVAVNSRIPSCDDVEMLAPNKACWVQYEVTYATAGIQTVVASVDLEQEVDESRETDNSRTRRIIVRVNPSSNPNNPNPAPGACPAIAILCTTAGQTGCTVDSENGQLRCNRAANVCTGQCVANGAAGPISGNGANQVQAPSTRTTTGATGSITISTTLPQNTLQSGGSLPAVATFTPAASGQQLLFMDITLDGGGVSRNLVQSRTTTANVNYQSAVLCLTPGTYDLTAKAYADSSTILAQASIPVTVTPSNSPLTWVTEPPTTVNALTVAQSNGMLFKAAKDGSSTGISYRVKPAGASDLHYVMLNAVTVNGNGVWYFISNSAMPHPANGQYTIQAYTSCASFSSTFEKLEKTITVTNSPNAATDYGNDMSGSNVAFTTAPTTNAPASDPSAWTEISFTITAQDSAGNGAPWNAVGAGTADALQSVIVRVNGFSVNGPADTAGNRPGLITQVVSGVPKTIVAQRSAITNLKTAWPLTISVQAMETVSGGTTGGLPATAQLGVPQPTTPSNIPPGTTPAEGTCGQSGQAPCRTGTVCQGTLSRTDVSAGICCGPNQKANLQGTACEACTAGIRRQPMENICRPAGPTCGGWQEPVCPSNPACISPLITRTANSGGICCGLDQRANTAGTACETCPDGTTRLEGTNACISCSQFPATTCAAPLGACTTSAPGLTCFKTNTDACPGRCLACGGIDQVTCNPPARECNEGLVKQGLLCKSLGTCTPATDAAACTAAGRTCGPYQFTRTCGTTPSQQTVQCGQCTGTDSCNTQGRCVSGLTCTGRTVASAGSCVACGTQAQPACAAAPACDGSMTAASGRCCPANTQYNSASNSCVSAPTCGNIGQAPCNGNQCMSPYNLRNGLCADNNLVPVPWSYERTVAFAAALAGGGSLGDYQWNKDQYAVATNGDWGMSPMANNQCMSPLVPRDENGLKVCRYPANFVPPEQRLPPINVGQSAFPPSREVFLLQAYGAAGVGNLGGNCMSARQFGYGVATGTVPLTHEGYKLLARWTCEQESGPEGYYGRGAGRIISARANGQPITAEAVLKDGQPEGVQRTVRLSRGGELDRASELSAFTIYNPELSEGWGRVSRTFVNTNGNTAPITMLVTFTPQSSSTALTKCKYQELPLLQKSPITFGGLDVDATRNSISITITPDPTKPRKMVAYRILCTDNANPSIQAVTPPAAWRFMGDVQAEIISPASIILSSCQLGDAAGYNVNDPVWAPLRNRGATFPMGAVELEHVAVKSVTAEVAGTGVALSNDQLSANYIWRGSIGATTDTFSSIGLNCNGVSCLHNPWGNVNAVYIPGFTQGRQGCPQSKWCDASMPPRISDTKPFVYVPVSRAQYDAGAAFLERIKLIGIAVPDYFAEKDPRLTRIRQGWLEASGMNDPSRWNRANTGWTLETAQWTEYQITCPQ